MGKVWESENFGAFDIEYFKEKYCKSDEQIKEAESILKCSIEQFYNHYIENHYDNLQKIRIQLNSSTFKQLLDSPYVNSVKSRVKNPYHLIDKLIRKVCKDTRYHSISLNNYHLYFDDLLGFRLIMLYLDDWPYLNDLILRNYSLDRQNFYSKEQRDNISNDKDSFIISKIEINIRLGDDKTVYHSDTLPTEFYFVNEGRYYRSVHYSIFYQGYCFEIQVRSAFDEAWSEVDHDIIYPLYLETEEYKGYSKLLNRIAGAGNEMTSYFRNVVKEQFVVNTNTATLRSVPDELAYEQGKFAAISKQNKISEEPLGSHSAKDILNEII